MGMSRRRRAERPSEPTAQSAGFDLWRTGGHNTAWGRNLGGDDRGPYVMVTDGRMRAPGLDDRAHVLIYANDDDEDPMMLAFPTFRSFLEALDAGAQGGL